MNNYSSEKFSQIKLIIWDLDETFWKGTLDDGDSLIIPTINVVLIKNLTDHGIVNSVCSKNDKEKAEKVLSDNGLLEYFVFNSIDWSAKGPRIKEVLSSMGLRAVNVLFIDDNHLNLEEVAFLNPGIMTAFPDIIPGLLESLSSSVIGKDINHKRLLQYKILEKKTSEKKKYDSDNDFLLSSKIQVEIHYECEDEIPRIAELISRSNQLNFTKLRSSIDEVESLVKDETITKGTVHVKDKFGTYGMVGFFAIKNNVAIHFLFSCRTIGMGIEQYVYHTLGCPKITIVGDVISDLSRKDSLKWINIDTIEISEDTPNILKGEAHSILFKGPCDMDQIFNFIKLNVSIDTELTYVNEKGVSIQGAQHTLHIVESLTLSEKQKSEIIEELPFADKDFFSTQMFSNPYSYVFLSTLHDSHLGIYRRKKDNARVVFGEAIYPLTDENYWDDYISGRIYNGGCKFSLDFLKWFQSNYDFCGISTTKELKDNILFIKRHLLKHAKLILMLGVESVYEKESNPAFFNASEIFKRNNDVIRQICTENSNILCISYQDSFHNGRGFYLNSYHFQPQVYYNVAQEICKIVGNTDGIGLSTNNRRSILFKVIRNSLRHNKIVNKLVETIRKFKRYE